MISRGQSVIAYFTILTTSVAAFAGATVWVIIPGALVLMTISFIEQRKFSSRFAAIGLGYVLTMAAWQRAGEAALASSAAYFLGAGMRLVG